MTTPDEAAMREVLRQALALIDRMSDELAYVQSVENCESGLCASGEGKALIHEAEDFMMANRVPL